ncbi:MAG: RidA family protein [Rhodospirillaceae bacterium]|jgi:enamine deaminase RidA (YjgF/YER057c/UK114 family)|nr:RidA family protein [Rhodospirillaceae bacterium]
MAGRIEAKLKEMGLELPEAFAYPKGNRRGCVAVDRLLFVSGHPPPALPGIRTQGKIDKDVSIEEGYAAARACGLLMLAAIKAEIGDLDRIERIAKLLGMVNASPGFESPFAVIDGASDLFLELWGPDKGQHARSAVGVAELPRGIPLEIEGIFVMDA